jgi:DNA-binding CsgD family transcriptional regulator
LIRVVEVAYQIDLDQAQWLEQLADVFSTMHGAEHGLMLYAYDASEPEEGAKIEDYALYGLDEDFARETIRHHAESSTDEIQRVYKSGIRCGTVSEILAPAGILPLEHESFGRFHYTNIIEDAWGLSASNPDGRGLGIAAPLAEVSQMSEAMRELWALVGVHLATAYRLRSPRGRGGAREDEEADTAILEPDGTLIHAEGVAFEDSSREKLSDSVRQIDRARSRKLRHEPHEALPMWKGLVEGRWTLVERNDSDGRRFVVAHPNDPRFDQPQALTQRERQVVAYAAQGDSTERISYSLGFDQQSVETLLASAMEKLGVKSREALRLLRDQFS